MAVKKASSVLEMGGLLGGGAMTMSPPTVGKRHGVAMCGSGSGSGSKLRSRGLTPGAASQKFGFSVLSLDYWRM